MFIGIKDGESYSGSAGATRKTVTLAIQGNVIIVGDRKVAVADDILVLWHQEAAGTWHGVKDPEVLKTVKPSMAPSFRVGVDVKGVELVSSSGGADIAALVVKVDRQLAIVTSGYDGRQGWSILLATPDSNSGSFTLQRVSPADYRAEFAKVEML